MLYENTNNNTTFFSIAKGSLVRIIKQADGTTAEKTYRAVDGILTKISKKEVSVNQTPKMKLNFFLQDGQESYCVSVFEDSGVAKDIIRTLAAITDFSQKITINPYLTKDGKHTNVSISQNGKRCNWVAEKLPETKFVNQATGNEFLDFTNLVKWIDQKVDAINNLLSAGITDAPVPTPDDGDMPDFSSISEN